MTIMRPVLLAMGLVLATTAQAMVIQQSTLSPPWYADGIAVGKVIGQQERTIDIEIQEWMRDGTRIRREQIRAFRCIEVSCLIPPPVDYAINSR